LGWAGGFLGKNLTWGPLTPVDSRFTKELAGAFFGGFPWLDFWKLPGWPAQTRGAVGRHPWLFPAPAWTELHKLLAQTGSSPAGLSIHSLPSHTHLPSSETAVWWSPVPGERSRMGRMGSARLPGTSTVSGPGSLRGPWDTRGISRLGPWV